MPEPRPDARPATPSATRSGAPRVCPVLVGRDDLVALAGRRLASVGAGSGHLLLLSGEAGVGKTRLLAEISGRAGGDGFTVVAAGAFPGDTTTTGGLLAELAAGLVRSSPSGAAAGAAGGRMAARLRDAVDGTGDGDAHRRRRLLVTDLAEALGAAVPGPRPVLLALEDLHWADDLTLDVLERIAGRLADRPVLVVATCRTDELYPRVPMRAWRTRLLNQRLAEEVRLSRLDREGCAAMLAAINGSTPAAALTDAVFARSDGIPLHVEEFLASAGAIGGDGVPDTLADAVLARAQALTAPARALAEAASVIGRTFDLDLLTAVAAEPPGLVDKGLRELTDRFFVQPAGDGTAGDGVTGGGVTYDFRHALIRDAFYAGLNPHRRRELHGRSADAAVAAGFGGAFVSEQYERAHRPALAHRYALAAAEGAVAVSAHREAVALYRRAQRTAPASTMPSARAALLAALATELAASDDNDAAARSYAEAVELRRGSGDEVGAAALVPGLVAVRHLLGAGLDERTAALHQALAAVPADHPSTSDTRARILAGLSAAYMLDRRLDPAIEYGDRASRAAADAADPAVRGDIDATLGSVLVFGGRMDEGWRLLRGAIERCRDAGTEAEAARGYRMIGSCASMLVEYELARQWLPEGIAYAERTERFNDRHYMAAHLAHVHWAGGAWADAAREARRALADGGGVTTRITALHVLGYLGLGRGDWAGAAGHLDEARVLGEQMAELQRVSPAWWGLAEIALHSGRLAEAVGWCERGYAASAEVEDAAYLFPFVLTGVRGYLAREEVTAARDWLRRSSRLLVLRGIPGTLPALDHARGLLHLREGQTGKAREALEAAAAGWDGRGRFWEGTQVLLDLSRCALRSRRPGDAATLAVRALDRATEVGAATLVTAARRLLDGRRTAPAGDRTPLTAREVEVARLVATGATNRQIAVALSIAPKTVAAHVEHILTKLGAARRAEIAAWAAGRSAVPGQDEAMR